MSVRVVSITELPSGFAALRDEADREGYRSMRRLEAELAAGTTAFEPLLAVLDQGDLLAIGGLTADPVAPSLLRIRRLYVRPSHRGRGIGRMLSQQLVRRASVRNRPVTVNAADSMAARFWIAVGFVPDERDRHTHLWGGPTELEVRHGRRRPTTHA